MSELINSLNDVLATHPNKLCNPERKIMIKEAVDNKEVFVSKTGTLATWTPAESTGRSPADTAIVKREDNLITIDWTSKYNKSITEELFDQLFKDALIMLKQKEKIYEVDRVIGADPNYALPVKLITARALGTLFADNMFRAIPDDIKKSCFYNRPFTLIALPYDKLNTDSYSGKLRKLPDGKTSNLIVAMDMERRLGLIIGQSYCGSIKKMIFTVMNYYLPLQGILPLHCSANESKDKECTLLLGLSGTGKTTLSADPERSLLGDDEHGWSDYGIANFENGCYAKMLDITESKEPEIYHAIMHTDNYLNHGAIIENAFMLPNGEFDFSDDRLTQNSRASYPLSFLKNIKPSSMASHPKNIIFLTADAYGVLPPVSRLNDTKAMLWFLMGYTSKLAGTETGVISPEATFSRFFGAPFMPADPKMYSSMLGEKMQKHHASVFLINTGWSGGSYGVGHRINLKHTRAMLNAAINGLLDNVEYIHDDLFHLDIPKTCIGVPEEILLPKNAWADKVAYEITSQELAQKFSTFFDQSYGNQNIPKEIVCECPGKKIITI